MAFKTIVKRTLWNFCQVKFGFLIKSFYSTKSIRTAKMKFDCPSRTAYFISDPNSEYFAVSVLVEHKPLNLSKNFTFSRPVNSTVSHFLARVDTKVAVHVEKKLKKSSVDFKMPEIKTALYRNGKRMTDDSPCCSLFDSEGEYQMEILGDSYCVICNAPWVNEITLPKRMSTNSVVFPQKFKSCFTDHERSSFTWYRSKTMAAYMKTDVVYLKDWVEVGNKFCYKIQDEDVGHYLKFVCIPRNETTSGPEFMQIGSCPVVASRNDYNFVQTHLLTREKVDDSKIRIVTYNLLADTYATTKEAKTMFDYCPPEVLNKDERFSAIAWEIAEYNADLLCLQEVENSVNQGFISPRLEDEGYGSFFCPKANGREGTACYYNKRKFRHVSDEKYTFGEEIVVNKFFKDIFLYLNQNKDFLTKFSELPHGLQMLVLQSCSRQDHLLVVGNVHLLSHPDADLIRLLQAISTFCLYNYTVEKLREKMEIDKISFILCGDFNSTPECAINQMVMNGLISADDPIWSSDEMKGAKGMEYKLPITMASAFNNLKFTNYTRVFKGCLDYIYYQPDSLEVSKTYPLPDENVLSANVGLPSIHFPSDHLPLIAELQWKT